jgi:arylformamidase
MNFSIDIDGKRWQVDTTHAHDLSIPLLFDQSQPTFFAAPKATSAPYRVGDFSGSVATGASCNCFTHSLTPHCNGTHTECVGHITRDPVSISEIAPTAPQIALLISVKPRQAKHTRDALGPASQLDDLAIDAELLERAISSINHELVQHATALIVRTLPNPTSKKALNYDSIAPAYFTAQAAQALTVRNIQHWLVDLPSVDRAHDQGLLAAHRTYWGMPPNSHDATLATRRTATITELCYIDDAIADGVYCLNLQVPAFAGDAAPSRPLIYPLSANK